MERFTRPLMEREGVRIIIGKGGLREGSLEAFRELGGVYLAVVGGAAALETTWIEAVEDVDLDDLNPESLCKFRIKGFGPLLVAMDSAWRQPLRHRERRSRAPPPGRAGEAGSRVMLVLPLLILMHLVPPPLGTVVGTLMLGRAHGTTDVDRIGAAACTSRRRTATAASRPAREVPDDHHHPTPHRHPRPGRRRRRPARRAARQGRQPRRSMSPSR